jgi:hypothetical protein
VIVNEPDPLLLEMQRIVKLAVMLIEGEPESSVKRRIDIAARCLGLSYRRARSFWYATAGTAVRGHELDAMRAQERGLLEKRRHRLLNEAALIEERLRGFGDVG